MIKRTALLIIGLTRTEFRTGISPTPTTLRPDVKYRLKKSEMNKLIELVDLKSHTKRFSFRPGNQLTENQFICRS